MLAMKPDRLSWIACARGLILPWEEKANKSSDLTPFPLHNTPLIPSINIFIKASHQARKHQSPHNRHNRLFSTPAPLPDPQIALTSATSSSHRSTA